MADEDFGGAYFPFDKARLIQEDLMKLVRECVSKQQNLIVHAPTGLGKTAAALAPSIHEALKKGLTVFFLTSRHTQHRLAMETVEAIKNRHKLRIHAVDIIGKKGFCLQPDVFRLSPRDFADYCQNMRDDDLCEFFSNTKQNGEPTVDALAISRELVETGRTDTESVISEGSGKRLCPYELAIIMAKDARVIVGDYYYIFHPLIRESFLKKCGKELSKSILIVDEGHNLPERVKDLATSRISSIVLDRAVEEARKNGHQEMAGFIERLLDNVDVLGSDVLMNAEKFIDSQDLLHGLREEFDFDSMIDEMIEVSAKVREEQRQSYIGSVAAFLLEWVGSSIGFARIMSKSASLKGDVVVSVHYRCLDPSIITRDVIRSAYCTILMSGTLNPTSMYKEVLGFDSAVEEFFKSPFPEANRLSIIVPKTSTKFEARSSAQYLEIAQVTAKITNLVPGNCAVFFPSYQLKDAVLEHFSTISIKTVFSEKPKFTKGEKLEFLDSFKSYKDSGAVLFGVIAGNFSEGIDLPGDLLKAVVIVGLPLQRPDLETESLIKYYDEKFKKGWDYGYLLPAFNKALQSAGRCIRTETDKGLIVFLDERYAWKNYYRCFPSSWDLKITLLYERLIKDFFKD